MRRDPYPAPWLNAAAATLAASVLSDSAAEHYRAGFHNRAMFVAPVAAAAAVAAAIGALRCFERGRRTRRAVFGASVLTGVAGAGFHAANISRRAGGWSTGNLFHGAPAAAPLAMTMAGVFGLAADALVPGNRTSYRGDRRPTMRRRQLGPFVGLLSAAGILGTSTEAGLLHFRGAFQNPVMYAPVVVPPLAGAALAAASLIPSPKIARATRPILYLTAWLGAAGVAFHAWGVHRRMGGWRNWRQNLLVGPPLPAPPAFTGLALAGLAAMDLLDLDRIP